MSTATFVQVKRGGIWMTEHAPTCDCESCLSQNIRSAIEANRSMLEANESAWREGRDS